MNLYTIRCYEVPSFRLLFFDSEFAESPKEAFEKLLEKYPGVKTKIANGVSIRFHHELIESGIEQELKVPEGHEPPPPTIFPKEERLPHTRGHPRKFQYDYKKKPKT